MKTFFIYALLIIGFFAVSLILENGLLMAMYAPISGEFDGYYAQTNSRFNLKNAIATACNVNGYLSFDLINTTGGFVDQCYLKVDLYNERALLADTEYIKIVGMQAGDTKPIHIKFTANHIEKFNLSIVQNTPDKTNIINILGWEIDLTNVFGLGIDLSHVTIFGTKLTDLFTWNNVVSTGQSFWEWLMITIKRVPGWAYFVALFFII